MSEDELVIEYIKIAVSIATPIAIVVVGFLLNRSIQTQNTFEERRRTLQGHWAEDFALVAGRLNEGVTNFIMIYFSYREHVMLDEAVGTNVAANPQPEIVEQHLELQRCSVELNKFYPYAPKTRQELSEAVEKILEEVGVWGSNNGGDVQGFLLLQDALNVAIYKVHAELLAIDGDA